MIREYLQMIFRNQDGKNVTISVNDPKEDLTEEDIETVMDEIIDRNIFMSPGGELKSKVAARVISRETDTVVEY
ncbi:DUF2922 domain-containing protein [Natranaerobius trueperi]|uniref:DUF2922 domain-containing protein n=1 Tax=Natranaerobius trueperi TaxID=759412 RepID=UPI00197C892E|nr:DUF2922 domain-containing protein [Natranaerobius trueperi]